MDSNSARPSLSSPYHVETPSLSTTIRVRDRVGPTHARAGHPRVETTRRNVRALLLTPDTTLAHLLPSVRKEIKIRPGFTPQEDVSRFRGTRQQAMDATALPKGHILGWVAPSSDAQAKAKAKGTSAPPPNKNARKRANQRARKTAEKSEAVKDSWEDEEDAENTSKTDDAAKEGTHSEVASGPSRDEAEITDTFSKLTVE